MNRSRYVAQPTYALNQYNPQPYGAVPAPGGMMPGQQLAVPSSTTYGSPPPTTLSSQSPIQNTLSPSSTWAATFANGPIIEDLCAPPPPPPPPAYAAAAVLQSPPLNAFHQRMPMHPSALPQVQDVFGVRQPVLPAFPGMHPHQAAQLHQHQRQGGVQRAVMLGQYPPSTAAAYGMNHHPAGLGMTFPGAGPSAPLLAAQTQAQPQPQQPQQPLEAGFPTAVMPAGSGNGGGVGVGVAAGQQQPVNSPEVGGNSSPEVGGSRPGDDGSGGGLVAGPALTPVEEALRGFLSPDMGNLGN
ncbi:hypothetical protein VTK26DRAFT_5653 [Humicola hyalothermophila]